MKIGLCFPYSQDDLSRDVMLEWFRRVDEGPFSALSCGERVVGDGVDMMALLAAAAAVTQRVEIVPTLYVLPMHPAIKVAKHAATLDLISGGRTTIRDGVGGRDQDYHGMVRNAFARTRRWKNKWRRFDASGPENRPSKVPLRLDRDPFKRMGQPFSRASWDPRRSRARRSGPTASIPGRATVLAGR
jgi:alkanesulfonate monooxygenase SsuD/methylene tetrahydromethanopterin reductase-like flavin-dependent oxidoreductase (luciferase family)